MKHKFIGSTDERLPPHYRRKSKIIDSGLVESLNVIKIENGACGQSSKRAIIGAQPHTKLNWALIENQAQIA